MGQDSPAISVFRRRSPRWLRLFLRLVQNISGHHAGLPSASAGLSSQVKKWLPAWLYGPLRRAAGILPSTWMHSFSVDQASLSEGLRAASAATALLLLGKFFSAPHLAWAAIAAFWTCLADAGGSSRSRFASMCGFALLSTVFGGFGVVASAVGISLAVPVILVVTTLSALSWIWGAAAYQVFILAATACVVMADWHVGGAGELLTFLLTYMSGALFAIFLSFTVWRIHPFGARRHAMRTVFRRLAYMARDASRILHGTQYSTPHEKGDTDDDWQRHAAFHRSRVRNAIEMARQTMVNTPVPTDAARFEFARLMFALNDAEQMFGHLIALTDAYEQGYQGRRGIRAARCLLIMAAMLRAIGRKLAGQPGQLSAARCWRALDQSLIKLEYIFSMTLRRRQRYDGQSATMQSAAELVVTALDETLPESAHGTESAQGFQETYRNSAAQSILLSDAISVWTRMRHTAAESGRIMRSQLRWRSPVARHAIRVGLATTSAFLVMRALQIPYGYWATMATLLILQPSTAMSWPRSVERALGSVLGGLLAIAIGYVARTPLVISLLIFPLVCAAMGLRRVSYSLFVLFLTPTFVLVADYAMPSGDLQHATLRLLNNLLGCAIAMLAMYFLWPERESKTQNSMLLEAIEANLHYLQQVCRTGIRAHSQPETYLESMRRTAGLASNAAEQGIARLQLERLHSLSVAPDSSVTAALTVLRRVAGTATRLRLMQGYVGSATLPSWIGSVLHDLQLALGPIQAGLTEPVGFLASSDDRPAPDNPVEAEAVQQMERLMALLLRKKSQV